MKSCLLIVLALGLLVGCAAVMPNVPENCGSTFDVLYTAQQINLDGELNEAIWQKAKSYPLALGQDRAADGTTLEQAGSVKFAWDKDNLYLAVIYQDSDIIALGQKNELHHYSMGDVAELFLKPANSPQYWELYVTPRGNKSTLFFPGKGRFSLPNAIEYSSSLKVAAKIDGTLNVWQDLDNKWTAEMKMPAKDLTAYGDKFGPGSEWFALVARYNYAKDLDLIGPELSMVPSLPETFFHRTDCYGRLNFVK